MTELDRLPPDQRAVLSLVLDRGKSYDEVADRLAIPRTAVRDRVHAALDALAGDPASGAPASGAPAGARARSGEPGEAHPRPPGGSTTTGPSSSSSSSSSPPPPPSSSPPPPRERTPRTPPRPPSSRRAGALLLGAIAVVIAVVAIVLSGGGGGKSSGHSSTATSSTSASTAKPTLDKTLALTSAEAGLKAEGVVYVLSENNRRAFYVAAEGLPPSSGFFYAVWLYNSPTESTPLGRAPTVGSNGHLEGGGPLPTNAGDYHQLIVTRETSSHPTTPGPIVMKGAFALH